MTERNVISVCVNNGIGVLGRVTGLFSRRGYNIISLNVAETENLGISRMTIVADGDEGVMEQLVKQLRKLYDVSEVKVLHNAVCREHIIMKVGNGPASRQPVIEIANLFRAKVVNVAESRLMLELTGELRYSRSKYDGCCRRYRYYRQARIRKHICYVCGRQSL